MIKTTNYTIKVTAQELKKNLASSTVDILTDALGDVELFETDLNMMQDMMSSIEKSGFKHLFKDGMTPMLLSKKDFEDVEDFFREHSADDDTLKIVIVHHEDKIEVIGHDDISY